MSRRAEEQRAAQLEELAGIIGTLGDKCLELDAQRRWLLEALEGYSFALAAALDEITNGEGDRTETRERVHERVSAILQERVDYSDGTLDRLFPQRSES